jgi:hypothetical protein
MILPKVTRNSTKGRVHTEMRANIMTSWGASISASIGPLLPALYSDWSSDVTECWLRSYVHYLMWSYIDFTIVKDIVGEGGHNLQLSFPHYGCLAFSFNFSFFVIG